MQMQVQPVTEKIWRGPPYDWPRAIQIRRSECGWHAAPGMTFGAAFPSVHGSSWQRRWR